MSVLTDLLNSAGSALSAPGDYTRGLLSGRPGERVDPRTFRTGFGVGDAEDDSWLGAAGDVATSVLTDPLTYAGGALVRALGQGASKIPGLLGARRGFAMAHGVDEAGNAARILGGSAGQKAAAQEMARMVNEAADPTQLGAYISADGVAFTRAGTGRQELLTGVGQRLADTTGRHETMHGLIDQAAKTGQTAGLPWLGRFAAWAKAGPDARGLRAGAGRLLDELAAHTYENVGLGRQLAGAGKFLVMPGAQRDAYAEYIRQASPLLGRLYQYTPHGLAAAGAGGAIGTAQATRGEP